MKGTLVITLVALVALGSASARGAVVLSDNFDSEPGYSAAGHVDASGDYDPQNWIVGEYESNGGVAGGGLGGSIDNRLQVTTYSSAANNNDPGAHSGNGYVRLVREHPYTHVEMRYGVAGVGANPMYAKAYFFGSSNGGGWNSGACGISFGFTGTGAPSMFVGLSDSGYINLDYLDPNTGWTDTGGDLILNGWYEAGIEITSYSTGGGAYDGTFDVWYNGAEVATNLPHDLTSPLQFRITTGGGIEYYVDDVEIGTGGIPEPATLAVLTLGSVVALLKRRRS